MGWYSRNSQNKTQEERVINCIVFNGKNLTEPKEIANAFNKYFSTS